MEGTAFRTPKSARTFETILKAATELFGTKGYHATTIRDVARQADLGLGALYYYVRSKEELVLRFYARINEETLRAYREQPELPTPLPEALTAYLDLKLERLAPYRDLMRVVMKEAVDPASPLSPLHPASAPVLAASLELFREMIVRADAARGAELEEMARALWLGHLAVLLYWLHDRSLDFRATRAAVETFAAFVRFVVIMRHLPGFGALRKQVYGLISRLFTEGA